MKPIRKIFHLNIYERRIMEIVFLSTSVPVLIVIGFYYCMFSDLVYTYLTSGMADKFLTQFLGMSIVILVYYFLFIFFISYKYVHKLLGGLPRILKELDEKIEGKSWSRIYLRQGDFAKELIKRINKLLEKYEK